MEGGCFGYLAYELVMQNAYAHSRSDTEGGSDSTNHMSASGSAHSTGQVPSTTYDSDGNVVSAAFSNPQMVAVNSYVADGLGHSDNWVTSNKETMQP